jgi:hypothetical protein
MFTALPLAVEMQMFCFEPCELHAKRRGVRKIRACFEKKNLKIL